MCKRSRWGKGRSRGGTKVADEAVCRRADRGGPLKIGVSAGGGTDGAEGRGTNYACIAPWLCSFCLDVEKKTRVLDGSPAAGGLVAAKRTWSPGKRPARCFLVRP